MDYKLNLISLVGIFSFCFIAWIGSENKKNIPWNMIVFGIGIQFLLGLFFLIVPSYISVIGIVNTWMNPFFDASDSGARFLFGNTLVPNNTNKLPSLVDELTGEINFQKLINPNTNQIHTNLISLGYIFAFRVLPQVIFFSAIFSLLYRINLIQNIVKIFSKIFQHKLKLSGAESLSGFTNIFFGIESILIIRPYLKKMTRSELLTVLTCCFGSLSGTILGMYATFLRPSFPNIYEHLLLASIMTIPACFVISKFLIPESQNPVTLGNTSVDSITENKNYLASLFLGGRYGVRVAVGIITGIIVVVGLVALVNLFFANLTSGDSNVTSTGVILKVITLDNIFGLLFFPLTFLTGVSLDMTELWQASVLIGKRFLQTSIPSYIEIGMLSRTGGISERAMLILSHTLCGFTHVPAIGIFVGGLASLAPSRFSEICSLTWKALWAATLATLMTGSFAGLFSFAVNTKL